MYEGIGDWFIYLESKEGCEELDSLFDEALYHISNDYYLAHYISWSLKDVTNMDNPFLPYYKLWCMGLEVSFVEKDKVFIFK